MSNNFAIFVFDSSSDFKGGCNDIHGFATTYEEALEKATNLVKIDNKKVVQILNYNTSVFSVINSDKIKYQKKNDPLFVKVVRVRTIEYNDKYYHQNVNNDNILYNIGDNQELSLCLKCEDIKERTLFTNHLYICNECIFSN